MAEAEAEAEAEAGGWCPTDKPRCKYGAKCFRQNSVHLKGFAHPPKEQAANRSAAKARQSRPSASRSAPRAAASHGRGHALCLAVGLGGKLL